MKQVITLVLVAALIPFAAIAQLNTGTLKGTIQNAKGELLKNATIQLVNTKFTTVTDGKGNFSFSNIPGAKSSSLASIPLPDTIRNTISESNSLIKDQQV